MPAWGLTALLPRAVGLRKAREMSITGNFVEAEEALRIGLVNHVVPDDKVMEEALACAKKIAKLPKQAVEDTRRVMNLHMQRAVTATIDYALTAVFLHSGQVCSAGARLIVEE